MIRSPKRESTRREIPKICLWYSQYPKLSKETNQKKKKFNSVENWVTRIEIKYLEIYFMEEINRKWNFVWNVTKARLFYEEGGPWNHGFLPIVEKWSQIPSFRLFRALKAFSSIYYQTISQNLGSSRHQGVNLVNLLRECLAFGICLVQSSQPGILTDRLEPKYRTNLAERPLSKAGMRS